MFKIQRPMCYNKDTINEEQIYLRLYGWKSNAQVVKTDVL